MCLISVAYSSVSPLLLVPLRSAKRNYDIVLLLQIPRAIVLDTPFSSYNARHNLASRDTGALILIAGAPAL